jgi:superfamily I DNA/RNA helicase
MNALETRTLEAFLRAVSLHEKPLPPNMQQEIRRIGHDLENHDTQSLRDIPALVQQDVALNKQYEYVYRSLQKQHSTQERTKSLTTAVNGSVSLDIESQIAQVFYAENFIESAQQFLDRLDSQSIEDTQQVNFWERGNRVVTLATGGAFLGVLLAQLPGAIIGGVLVALYAWFSAPYAKSNGDA